MYPLIWTHLVNIIRHRVNFLNPPKMTGFIFFYIRCRLLYLHSIIPGLTRFSLRLVNGGNALHSVGMKCSSRHTLAPIDSIFGGQLPPIIPPGARLVEAHSLQSEEAQLPPLYPGMFTVALREGQLPSLHPLCTSPWAVGLFS